MLNDVPRSFTQYCDLTRQFDPSPSPNTTNGLPNGTVVPPYKGPGVDTFIADFGRVDLLDYSQSYACFHSLSDVSIPHLVNKYWINQGGPNKDFWAHEVRLCALARTSDATHMWTKNSSQNTRLARRPLMSSALQITASMKT